MDDAGGQDADGFEMEERFEVESGEAAEGGDFEMFGARAEGVEFFLIDHHGHAFMHVVERIEAVV